MLRKILYNKNVILAENFRKMRKISKKVELFWKTQIVDHKIEQVLKLEIFKHLTFIIINLLKKNVRWEWLSFNTSFIKLFSEKWKKIIPKNISLFV